MAVVDEQARLTREARLHTASPEEVYRELQEVANKPRGELMARDDKVEAALVERNQPLINPIMSELSANKTPGSQLPGVLSLPGSLRRSWIEVALPAEHRGQDVLVVEGKDGRPREVGWHDRGAFEGGIAL